MGLPRVSAAWEAHLSAFLPSARDGSGSVVLSWPQAWVEAETSTQRLLPWPQASCTWATLTSAQISAERQVAWLEGPLWLSLGSRG